MFNAIAVADNEIKVADAITKKISFFAVWIVAIVLQIWDGIITYIFVGSGLIQEGNTLMASFINDGSFIFVKVMSILYFIGISLICYKIIPKTTVLSVLFVACLYLGVAIWNDLALLNCI